MPRPGRLCAAGHVHHVIQRGNNRQDVFFEDGDRRLFLRLLAEAAAKEGCALHAYVLMTNHVHLLLTATRAASLPRLMQSIGRRYVAHVNRSHGRTGTLWEGRYRATVLDSEGYLLACYRYIEANPVRAGLVARPQDYAWSSYRANALGRADPLLAPHETYLALGATAPARQAAYRALFRQGLEDEMLATLRDATQRGWVPGPDRFRAQIEAAVGRSLTAPRRGRPPGAEGKAAEESRARPRRS
jgi:putative transposase